MKRGKLSVIFMVALSVMLFYTNVSAQNSLLSLQVGMPYSVGNTVYSDWDGIIHAGLKYSNLRKTNLFLNVYVNYDRLNDSRQDWKSKQDLYKLGLGLQYKLMISETAVLYPHIGVGYAYQNIKNETNNSRVDQSGLNLLSELELLFKVKDKLNAGVSLRYDYIWLGLPESSGESSYDRHIHTITPTFQIAIEI